MDEKLKKVADELIDVMTKYPNLTSFLFISDETGAYHITGDLCLPCVIETLQDWVRDNNIKHLNEAHGEDVTH